MASSISGPTGAFLYPRASLLGNIFGTLLGFQAVIRDCALTSTSVSSSASIQEVLLLCRRAQQKWDLATVCLDHMRLAVKGLMPLSSSISVHYPGMAVMLQLLGALPLTPNPL